MKQGEFISIAAKYFTRLFLTLLLGLSFFSLTRAHDKYDQSLIRNVTVSFEETGEDKTTEAQFTTLLRSVLGDRYSLVKVREALESLYNTDKIVSAKVEATDVPPESVDLRFIIKRKVQAERVDVNVTDPLGETITEQELLLRVNLLAPGNSVTDASLKANADLIQTYLRDKGYYNAEVTYRTRPGDRGATVVVTF